MRNRMMQAVALALVLSVEVLHAAGGSTATGLRLPSTEVTDAIIILMERRFQDQIGRLAHYQAERTIRASSPMLAKPASWRLSETYSSPGSRSLETVSRDAPPYLDKLLLNPLVEAEEETAQVRKRPGVDITRANYSFTYVCHDAERRAHVFQVEPRTENKYLFRGLIWIDDAEFAVQRIEGSPARKPSVWVRESNFVHEFAKFDGFWLPVHHRSVAQLRMFGTATLDMTYSQYSWGKNP